jgi:NADP-dependent 3-hydroxy acid dehydrogenase YdfG
MNNKFDLDRKKFLVTGASSGIGREVCKLIHSFNGKFIAVARKENDLIELLNETSSTENSYVVADLTKEEDIARLVLGIGEVDGIVHSAGIIKIIPLKFYTKEVMNEMRMINLDSIMYLMSLITSKKKLNKGSSIVLVSSLG